MGGNRQNQRNKILQSHTDYFHAALLEGRLSTRLVLGSEGPVSRRDRIDDPAITAFAALINDSLFAFLAGLAIKALRAVGTLSVLLSPDVASVTKAFGDSCGIMLDLLLPFSIRIGPT